MTATTTAGRATATATCSKRAAGVLAAAVVLTAVTLAATACGALASGKSASDKSASDKSAQGQPASAGQHPSRAVPPVRTLTARLAPVGWHRMPMVDGAAVLAYLSYPPGMHVINGDRGSVSAARFDAAGTYLMYLNATPKQGAESLRDWPSFRVGHLLDEDAARVRLLAESQDVKFIGGTGTCVLDAYVTKDKANHYTELACFVRGAASASVIIAAAPTAHWTAVSGSLLRAVAAYQVR